MSAKRAEIIRYAYLLYHGKRITLAQLHATVRQFRFLTRDIKGRTVHPK